MPCGVGARRHTDLDAWKLADELRSRTQVVIAGPRFRQQDSLRSQLGRASQSACANIAEGFARYQPKDFARFLRISKGSILEAREHLLHASQLNLVSDSELVELSSLANRAIGALVRLIRYLETAKAP